MLSLVKRLAPHYGNDNEENRLKWLEQTLQRVPAGSRLLDAGAGELRNKVFCSHLNYVAQDFCQYDGGGDGSGLQTGTWDTSKIDLVSDITDIPAPDSSFDVILCTEVLEHLPNPLAALEEFARLLRPGGTLIVTAPFCSLTHFAPFHFYSGFNRYFYLTNLPQYGFEVEELLSNGDWFKYLAQEIRRLPSVSKEGRPSVIGLLVSYLVVGLLRLLSRNRISSDALLCFGYFCVARKPIQSANPQPH